MRLDRLALALVFAAAGKQLHGRLKARVKTCGHDVPEEDQRRRYPRPLANVDRLLPRG